jgi:aspartyl-tRNA(Asn)/glutamyl-tRNA(Gln) amidotransferase subunit A
MFEFGRRVPPEALARARQLLARIAAALNDALPEFDAVLSLTAPQAAFAFGAPEPANQAEFTALANFAGCPALSIPFALDDGLPLGLQLMAARGTDRRLLRIGAVLEGWIGFAESPR